MTFIPSLLPPDMQRIAEALRLEKTQEDCLRYAYAILVKKYHGNRLKTITHFFELFPRSMDELWARSGFLHCTNLNWLLGALLVHSGHFTESDLRTRWTLLHGISPHQYLLVRMNDGTWVDADVWAHVFGIPFGDHAHGFHVHGARKRDR